MSEPHRAFLPYSTLCTRLQSCSWGPCSASGGCLHCKFCIWHHHCVAEGEMRSLDFYRPMSDKCCVDHYHGDCCSGEPPLKRSLLAWTCKKKQWRFISLGGIDSALEHSRTHQTPSPRTVGAWATAARSSCLYMVLGALPVLFTSRTECSRYLFHLPCSNHVSLVHLSFVHEGCWTGGNGSSISDTTVGCQRCWLLGAGPASSWSQTLPLLWWW